MLCPALIARATFSVGMNPSTRPRTRLERAGPRSGPARSQTWRSGCRVPGHTPSVSTRGVGSADYPPVRIFAAIGTSRGELEERRSHKPGETFSRPNPTLSTPVFVNLRGSLSRPARSAIGVSDARCVPRPDADTLRGAPRERGGKRKAPGKPPWGKDLFT